MSFDPLAQFSMVLRLREMQDQAKAREEEKKKQALQAGLQLAQNPLIDVSKAATALSDLDPAAMPFLIEVNKAAKKQQKTQADQAAASGVLTDLGRLSPIAASSAAGTLNPDLSVAPPSREANLGFVGLQNAIVNASLAAGEPEAVRAARLAVAPIQREAARTGLKQQVGEMASQRYEANLAHIRGLKSQSFGDEKDLRGEYFKVSQPFIEQRNAIGRVRASAQELALDPGNAQGDIALLFNFLKVLDPGSTIREGEFERARQTAGIPQQILAYLAKVEKGSTLTPQQRRAIVARAETLYRQGQSNQKRLTRQFEGIAKRNELDPRNVLLDIADEEEINAPPPPPDEPGATFLQRDALTGNPIFVRPDGSTFMVAP